jgi:quercetin dioxygenase-like cupin family protein
VRITRVFAGGDEQSHFEDLEVPEEETAQGWLTEWIPATGVMFRHTPPGGSLGFHQAPRRQLVFVLHGAVEIECGDGSVRRLGAGDVLLADDTTGQGHISREVQSPRRTVFVPLPDDLDVSAWRPHQ